MPINAKKQVSVLSANGPYDRMAFRCAMTVRLVGGAVAPDSTLSLHGTRYRKPGQGKFDVCGLVGEGEIGASLNPAAQADATLMRDIALACRSYAGLSGNCAVALNFAWRPENGDLVGMAMLTVTPEEGGEPVSKSSGNTNTLSAEDPAFAATFATVFAAIDSWCSVKGW